MEAKTKNTRTAPPSFSADDRLNIQNLIGRMIARARTSMPVRVEAVTNDGGVSPIGYVDIHPLVSQLDANGNVIDHTIIYNVPYMRIQGGANAIILDPKVGDIGIAVFCDRDISNVKENKTISAPATLRKHDMSDAIYLMSMISVIPTQYIRFHDGGIAVHTPNTFSVNADKIDLHANSEFKFDVNGHGQKWDDKGVETWQDDDEPRPHHNHAPPKIP